MARQPFEYVEGCTGPVVDLDIVPPGFPICDTPHFEYPNYIPRPIQFPLPSVFPPPFCPCVPPILPSTTSTFEMTREVEEPQMDLEVVNTTDDCCEPEFQINYNIELPCIPFDIRTVLALNGASGTFLAQKEEDCTYTLSLALDIAQGGICIGPKSAEIRVRPTYSCEGIKINNWSTALSIGNGGCLEMNTQVDMSVSLLAALANPSDTPPSAQTYTFS